MKVDISFADFKKKLRETGYIADNSLALQVYLSLQTQPTGGAFLFGPVGAGKTDLVNKTAEALGLKLFFKQIFDGIKVDNFYVGFTVDKQGNPVATDGVLIEMAEYLEKNKDAKAILLIDEIDKAQPKIDAMFLDFLQNGRISYLDKKFEVDLSRLAVFFTSNDYRPITDALLRRLPAIYVEKPSPSLMEQILREKGIDDEYSLTLAKTMYIASLNTELSKPITAQELYQFCLAIQHTRELGEGNIDTLIYQFLTKDYSDFYALRESLKNISKEDLIMFEEKEEESFKDVIEKKVNQLNINIGTDQVLNGEAKLSLPNIEIKKKEELVKEFERIDLPERVEYGYVYLPDTKTLKAIALMMNYNDIKVDEKGKFGPFEIVKNKKGEGIFLIQNEPISAELFKTITDTADVKGSVYIEKEFNLKENIEDFLIRVKNTIGSSDKASVKYLDKESVRIEVETDNNDKLNIFANMKEDKFILNVVADLEKGYSAGVFLEELLSYYYDKEKQIKEEIAKEQIVKEQDNENNKAENNMPQFASKYKEPARLFITMLRNNSNMMQKIIKAKDEYPYSLKEIDPNDENDMRKYELGKNAKYLEDIKDIFVGDIEELKKQIEAVKRGELDPDDILYFPYNVSRTTSEGGKFVYVYVYNKAYDFFEELVGRIKVRDASSTYLKEALYNSTKPFEKKLIPILEFIRGDLHFLSGDDFKSYVIKDLEYSTTYFNKTDYGENFKIHLPTNHTEEDFNREVKRVLIERLVISDLINKRQLPILLRTAKDILGIEEDFEEILEIESKKSLSMRL